MASNEEPCLGMDLNTHFLEYDGQFVDEGGPYEDPAGHRIGPRTAGADRPSQWSVVRPGVNSFARYM